MNPIRIAVNGAAGRMGQRLVALGHADPELEIVAALEAVGHPQLGNDAGQVAGIGPIGVTLASTLSESVDAMIDFSTPAGTDAVLSACERGRFHSCWPRPGWKWPSGPSSSGRALDPAFVGAEHEPGRQPGDEARSSRLSRAERSCHWRRRRNHRAASSI